MDAHIESEIAALASGAAQGAALPEILQRPDVKDLLAGVLAGSPYLSGVIRRDPARLARVLGTPPEHRFIDLKAELAAALDVATTVPDAMRVLREFKAEVALLTALADLA